MSRLSMIYYFQVVDVLTRHRYDKSGIFHLNARINHQTFRLLFLRGVTLCFLCRRSIMGVATVYFMRDKGFFVVFVFEYRHLFKDKGTELWFDKLYCRFFFFGIIDLGMKENGVYLLPEK